MAAKKSAKTVLAVPGRRPPPIEARGELAEALVAIEALACGGKLREAMLASEELRARDDITPMLAIQLLDALPRDLGEIPDTIDWSAAKTAPQRKQLQASHDALGFARHAREQSFATLCRLGARDLGFQLHAWRGLDDLPKGSHLFRGTIKEAMTSAPNLAPEIEAELVTLARGKHEDPDAIHALTALLRHGKGNGLRDALDNPQTADELFYAKQVVIAGQATGAFSSAPAFWHDALAALAKRGDEPWSPSQGDAGRARWQAAGEAKDALAALKQAAPPKKPAPPKKGEPLKIAKAPIDRKKLKTGAQREAALDTLAEWLVEQLLEADDTRALEAIRGAIDAFYTIREAGDQPRGEYAGHFFMVDGVGLDESDRAVPWEALGKKVGKKRLAVLTKLFGAAEREVE